MTRADRERLRRLPKAELHLHLEGCVPPALLWELSQRHGLPLPHPAACDALYRFHDFAGFINAIKTASQLLQTPADYAQIVTAMAARLKADGVVYAEVFVSIGILLWRQVPIEPYWEAMEQARIAAEAATGVTIRWLFDAVRQFGAAPFDQVVNWALRLQPSGTVIGIGIGGDEARGPATWFAKGYARAAAAGLHRTVHAGESCGADSVRAAVERLGAERIGHGLRSYEDPTLVALLAQRQVCLDVCPTSNRKTGSWSSTPMDPAPMHPAVGYLNAGVPVTLSTDDPGIFGCSLSDEYALLYDQLGFSLPQLHQLLRNSFRYSFLDDHHKRQWGSILEAQLAALQGDSG